MIIFLLRYHGDLFSSLTVGYLEKVSATAKSFVKEMFACKFVGHLFLLQMVNTAVEFAEDAKRCKAHPRKKAFILVAIVLRIIRVKFPDVAMPVGR